MIDSLTGQCYLLQVLDGNIFEKLQDYLSLLSRYELDACTNTEEAFVKSLHATAKVNQY